MELKRMLALMLAAAAFLCSGNLCIIASKADGLVPYSSVTVTFLIEVFKLIAMLTAIAATKTAFPRQVQVKTSWYYAVPALLSALESNLNYVVLRYLDAATVSVLWNLKILLTAVLFRYVLKQPLSELHKLAIVLLILGVLTSQSDRFSKFSAETSQDLVRGLSLALVGVTMSSCASVFAEWTLKKQSDCPFLWQSVQMYTFGVVFNSFGLLMDGNLLSEGFFHGYSGWTVVVIVVNSIGGIVMACILKYLDNIACVYSHSMAMMFTTLLSMIFFAFSPSLEFACGLGVLVISMYLYHHPLAQVSETSSSLESDARPKSTPGRLFTVTSYKQIQKEIRESPRTTDPPGCVAHPWSAASRPASSELRQVRQAASNSRKASNIAGFTKVEGESARKVPSGSLHIGWSLVEPRPDSLLYYTVGNTTVCHVVVPQFNVHGNYIIGRENTSPFHTAPSSCANDSFLFEAYMYHASVGFYSFYEVDILEAYDINGVFLAEDIGSTKPRMSYWRYGRRCEQLEQHEAVVFAQENLRLTAHGATNFQRAALLYLIIEGIMTDLFLLVANDGWVSKVQYVSLGYNLSGLILVLYEMLERTKWLKEKWRLFIKRLFFGYETALVGELVTALVFQMVLSRLNASEFKRSKPTALAVSYYIWSLTCHGAVVLVILSIILSVRVLWALIYVWWKHRSLAVFSAPCCVDTALGPRSRSIMLGGYNFQDGKLFYKKSTLRAFGLMKVEEEDTCYLVLPKLYWISTPRDNLIVIGVISGHRVEPLHERSCSGIATLIDHKLGGISSQPENPHTSTAQVVAWSEALFRLELAGDGVWDG